MHIGVQPLCIGGDIIIFILKTVRGHANVS